MNPRELISLCEDKTVWIQTHNFPDPDAISSAFGLQKLLENFDIESKICHVGLIDKLSSIKLLKKCGITVYSYSEIKDEMKPEDFIILVDCQKNNGNTDDLIGDEVAVIDHHPVFTDVKYQYADLRICGACASIIMEYYKVLGVEPEEKAATALLYGLRMDTLKLSRGVTSLDVEMYEYIFQYIKQKRLRSLETNNIEFKDLNGYSTAISNVTVFGKVAFSYLDYKCPDALVAILSDFMVSLAEVEVIVMFACRDNGYKFSIRSEHKEVDSGMIAHEVLEKTGWGTGGGHALMAGGFVKRNVKKDNIEQFFDEVQSRFLNMIKETYPELLEQEN